MNFNVVIPPKPPFCDAILKRWSILFFCPQNNEKKSSKMRAMECARSESTQALKQTNKFWGAYDLMSTLDDIIFI